MQLDLSCLADHLLETLCEELELDKDESSSISPADRINEFTSSHPEAEKAVSLLIFKHIGLSKSLLKRGEFDRDFLSENRKDELSNLIVPHLSPVRWLSDESWVNMGEEEKLNFMTYILRDVDGHQFFSTSKVFRKYHVVNFGPEGIDRIVLGHGPKHVLVLVGIHGNELCGVHAVQLLLQKRRLFQGNSSVSYQQLEEESRWEMLLENLFDQLTIEFVIGNPKACQGKTRFLCRNLNRMFKLQILVDDTQAKEEGYEYELHRARILAESIRHSDCVLDIHSCSSDSESFAMPSSNDLSEVFAEQLPVKYVVESLIHRSIDGGTTLDCALLHGVPGIAVECGQHDHVDVVARAVVIISTFLFQMSNGTTVDENSERPVKMRCEGVEMVQEGFEFLKHFQEFECIPHDAVVFRDDIRGEVRCPIKSGAYLVMPTKLPVVGEEALFWAVAQN